MFSKFLFLAFILIMANSVFAQSPTIEAGVPQGLARWRAANYSDVRYKLNLTLEKMSPTLKGTIEVSLKNKGDQIVLDWRKTRGKEDLSKISNVFINGKPAFRSVSEPPASAQSFNDSFKFEEINEHLVFRDGVVAGENVIKLDFTSPIAPSGAAVTRYVDKEDGAEYVYSLFVPSDASTAFPVFDQPDLKARFQLNVTAPLGWKIVSNSPTPLFTIYDGKYDTNGLRTFQETKPISTYVFAFAAGDFVKVSEPPAVADGLTQSKQNSSADKSDSESSGVSQAKLQPPATAGGSSIYVRKSQAEKFKAHEKEVFRLNREAVKYLESYFDFKFPFPKYDLVLIPEFPFGGMEHAGATFLRESSVIFPSEPTANDFISRANLIFHEAAHQWFGDTVTMRWFDDLWLKEGFAEFTAYKTLEKVLPEYNAWKAFYERNKPLAYLTDSTRGTTPIYQEIPNLSSAKSAYGNIVYRKAPSFLRQAEFYLGEDKFKTAVRAFLKKYQFSNAEWTDLVREFETASGQDLKTWANAWVKKRGLLKITHPSEIGNCIDVRYFEQANVLGDDSAWDFRAKALILYEDRKTKERKQRVIEYKLGKEKVRILDADACGSEFGAGGSYQLNAILPNYQDYGYGIFLLDAQSRDYVLQNIRNEKDAFLRSMMWGALWDSVREAELDPTDYVELAIKNISVETDELTIQTILSRVSTAMNYYIKSKPPAIAGGLTQSTKNSGADKSDLKKSKVSEANLQPSAAAGGSDLTARLENLLIEKIRNAPTPGRRITFYRAFLNVASTENARAVLKQILSEDFGAGGGDTKMRPGSKNEKSGERAIAANPAIPLKTKDKFDIVTRLLILGDPAAPSLLAQLEKTETSDEARRYAYAARAGIATAENKAKFWNDFVNNREISESWIESAFVPFNSIRHSELTLPYLEKALAELPNLKRNRKIFFVNGWLAAFIGGQTSEKALAAINKFLADNPNLDRDLRLKILENLDVVERAVRIRTKYGKQM